MENRNIQNRIGRLMLTAKLKAKLNRSAHKILDPDQAATVLCSCEDPLAVLHLVLPLFAGLRSDEVARLQWRHFHSGESIIVLSQRPTAKPGLLLNCLRSIPIPPVLEAWLKPFYDCNPAVFTDLAIREQASLALRSAGISDGRQLRETFLTYSLEFCCDRLTDWEMMVDVELKHLQGRFLPKISEDTVDRMFSLTPKCIGLKDWHRRVVRALKRFPAVS